MTRRLLFKILIIREIVKKSRLGFFGLKTIFFKPIFIEKQIKKNTLIILINQFPDLKHL